MTRPCKVHWPKHGVFDFHACNSLSDLLEMNLQNLAWTLWHSSSKGNATMSHLLQALKHR